MDEFVGVHPCLHAQTSKFPLLTTIDVKSNVQAVLEAIDRAADKAGRPARSVQLVAVCKTVSVDRIVEALDAGVTDLGENKVQEAVAKGPHFQGRSATLHMIGPLQKNKASKAAEIFSWIETLDDLDLAARLDRGCERLNKILPVLVQVNVSREPTKSGILEEDALEFVRQAATFRRLSIRGLMTIPPYLPDPEAVRPYFGRLRKLAEQIDDTKLTNVSMAELSMGMSHDFPVAIEEGATLVRVGTAIFGARQL
jgi:pyridoxal phosphate enzyme (YggS family)